MIKRKAVEDLVVGKDMLYSKAGNIAPPGALVTDSLVQRLLRHRTPVVTVIYPTREDSARGGAAGEIEELLRAREETAFYGLRNRLFECSKKIYKPYSELTNRAFWGKLGEKLIKADFLLERKPTAMYKQGIFMGSTSIFSSSEANGQYNDKKAILECLDGIFSLFESSPYPRLYLDSIRLGAIHDTGVVDRVRVLDPGNSLAWHATDTAILTLAALAGMSARRRAQGLPESTEEFERQRTRITSHQTISVKSERFHYPRETIIDAALGCVLHGLGFAHLTINRVASKRPLLDGSPRAAEEIKTLRKSQFVVRNLIEERSDISAISKKVILQMKRYPDGSGYPFVESEEAAGLPEYARMANIADDFDELVNPVLNPHPMGRIEAMSLLRSRAGDFRGVGQSARYDRALLDEFSLAVKAYEEGERVDLFLDGKRGSRYFCGFARGGPTGLEEGGFVPEVCVLKNELAGESYAYGRVAFDLEGARVLLLDEAGRVGASIDRSRMDERDEGGGYRIKNPKIREMLRCLPDLVGLDEVRDSWSIGEYRDPVFDVTKPAT